MSYMVGIGAAFHNIFSLCIFRIISSKTTTLLISCVLNITSRFSPFEVWFFPKEEWA